MTVYKNTNHMIEKSCYSAEDLMRLRRERIRDRRLREGSLLCGQILRAFPSDNLIELVSVKLDKAM